MKKYLKILTVLITLTSLNHQAKAQEIKGYIHELASSNPIWNATIKNLRTQQQVNSNRDGSFKIAGQVNDYLEISNTGYLKDTVFYYEEDIRRIYMNRDESVITIDEVLVRRLTDSRLALEIEKARNEGKITEVSKNKGGLRISPSRLFGKNAKEARKNLDLLITEQNNRKIDRIITTNLIASLVPLNQEEIALFRERFRPSLEFTEKASPEDIRLHIIDSYNKFKASN